jgi:hypothetical protein
MASLTPDYKSYVPEAVVTYAQVARGPNGQSKLKNLETQVNSLALKLKTATEELESTNAKLVLSEKRFTELELDYTEVCEGLLNFKASSENLELLFKDSQEVVVALSAKVNEYSIKEDARILKEFSDVENTQKPTNADMLSTLQRAGQVVSDMGMFAKSIENLNETTSNFNVVVEDQKEVENETPADKEKRLKNAKCAEMQKSLTNLDSQYDAFKKSYKDIQTRVNVIIGELSINAAEANKLYAIPTYCYPSISAKLAESKEVIESKIKDYDTSFKKSNEMVINITNKFSEVTKVLDAITTNLNNIDHAHVVLRDGAFYTDLIMSRAENPRLSPNHADFFAEKKVELKVALAETQVETSEVEAEVIETPVEAAVQADAKIEAEANEVTV